MLSNSLNTAISYHTKLFISELLDEYIEHRTLTDKMPTQQNSSKSSALRSHDSLLNPVITKVLEIFGCNNGQANPSKKRSSEDLDLSPRKKAKASPRDSKSFIQGSQSDEEHGYMSEQEEFVSKRSTNPAAPVWTDEETNIFLSYVDGKKTRGEVKWDQVQRMLPNRSLCSIRMRTQVLKKRGLLGIQDGHYKWIKSHRVVEEIIPEVLVTDVEEVVADEAKKEVKVDPKTLEYFKVLFIQQGCPQKPNWTLFCKYLPGKVTVEECKILHQVVLEKGVHSLYLESNEDM